MANKSDDLRDLLADYLIDAIKNPEVDPETGSVGRVDPRVLAVARAFVKDNPPESLPTPESSSGMLDEFLNHGKLPFDGTSG